MDELNQLMVKQLKNRYNDPTLNRKFVIGVDRAKMKLYDVEASAQRGLSQSGQIEELDTKFGSGIRASKDYSDIKF
jgi:hypothetical protein